MFHEQHLFGDVGNTMGSPPSMTATTELVVPRSIPITFAIVNYLQALYTIECASNANDNYTIIVADGNEYRMQDARFRIQ